MSMTTTADATHFVACRGTGGTLSEIALALRFGRPVVLLDFDPGDAFLAASAAAACGVVENGAPTPFPTAPTGPTTTKADKCPPYRGTSTPSRAPAPAPSP